jgi:hypothetical protein
MTKSIKSERPTMDELKAKAAEIRDNKAKFAELRAAEERRMKAWELTEMVNVPGLGKVTIAALRWAFEQVEDKVRWKRSIMAKIPGRLLLITAAAVEFYHGEKPQVKLEPGYNGHPFIAWSTVEELVVLRPFCDYWIRSQGYACD